MNKNFDKFVDTWNEQITDIKVREKHLLFLVVCPDKLEWDFSIEKQCQTTTFMVSGGATGASVGHDVQFCYRSQVNFYLKKSQHTHAMIVSIGVVFDMAGTTDDLSAKWRNNFTEGSNGKIIINQLTPITDFYDFVESGEYIKAHIIAKPGEKAFLHHQHINLNVDMWKEVGCPALDERWETYKRSEENYHDDYTPYWLTPKYRPTIQNFTHEERRRKAFSYYREQDWKNFNNASTDYYFSRFMTRIQQSFYIFNTESLKRLPDSKFDLIFSPTAGYSAESYVNKLNFQGDVILYDYAQENLDIKKMIVDWNMSLDELYMLKNGARPNSLKEWFMVDNSTNLTASQRTKSMGTHEELRALQLKMSEEQDVHYWLMNLIEPNYTTLLNQIRGRDVFFDASNIFSYHMSHAHYTIAQLIESYERLHEILGYANSCWFQGTKPTKQWERKWISSVSELEISMAPNMKTT